MVYQDSTTFRQIPGNKVAELLISKEDLTEIEKSLAGKRWGGVSTQTVDSRAKFAQSWNQIKSLTVDFLS